jgi:hypothetical protein
MMTDRSKLSLLLVSLFAFRLYFGLCHPFFNPDELQTYLIGLKWFCEGGWPYFGPDLIVTETGFYTQIPGALEALVVGLPLRILPIPEAPFIFLNLLSLAALALLARTIARRVPEIPFAFILTWLALLPWSLQESAHIYNPCFLWFGSALFFTGFIEAVPGLTLKDSSPRLAFALMGFGLFWNMQFHFSWILLPPFLLAAILLRWKSGQLKILREGMACVLGAAFPLAFLIPTLLKYGIFQSAGGAGTAVGFNPVNFQAFFVILARFFSFPSFEVPRFLGFNTALRVEFFKAAPWLIPPGLFLLVLGFIQPFFLLIAGWFKDGRHPGASAARNWAFIAFLEIWVSFWFTSKEPAAHIYYGLAPLLLLYSFFAWSRLARYPWGRILGVACLVAGVWFQGGFATRMMKTRSLYTNRALVVKAIQEKNYHLLGERRPGSKN